MKRKRSIPALVLATGVILGGVVLAANPEGAAPPTGTTAKPKPGPGAPASVNVKPWEAVALRPEHAVLAGLVGHWTVNVRPFVGPYVREREKGVETTADGKLLMGGLFVQVTQAEKRMKQPLERMTIYGFDEVVGKYTSDSFETTSTSTLHHVGTYDAEKKQIILSSHYSDQKTRLLTISRTVTTFVDANTWTYEEYISRGVGGAETQTVLMTFKRP